MTKQRGSVWGSCGRRELSSLVLSVRNSRQIKINDYASSPVQCCREQGLENWTSLSLEEPALDSEANSLKRLAWPAYHTVFFVLYFFCTLNWFRCWICALSFCVIVPKSAVRCGLSYLVMVEWWTLQALPRVRCLKCGNLTHKMRVVDRDFFFCIFSAAELLKAESELCMHVSLLSCVCTALFLNNRA